MQAISKSAGSLAQKISAYVHPHKAPSIWLLQLRELFDRPLCQTRRWAGVKLQNVGDEQLAWPHVQGIYSTLSNLRVEIHRELTHLRTITAVALRAASWTRLSLIGESSLRSSCNRENKLASRVPKAREHTAASFYAEVSSGSNKDVRDLLGFRT